MKRSDLICAVLFSIAFIVSCRKSTLIGDELIPDSDFLHSQRTDTFRIITTTTFDDSAVTSLNLFYSLGSLESDTFGKVSANIYTQVLLPSSNLYFGVNPVVDSVVLLLDYAGLYGSLTAQHSLNVYKLLEDIDASRLYYSNSKLHDLPVLIGSKHDFVPNTTDSIEVLGTKYPAHLRIKLSDWFAQELINSSDTTRFIDNTRFTDFLKGFLIETDTTGTGNSVMHFDLASFVSGMAMYYKNDASDSLVTVFPFSGTKYNYYTHNYAGIDPVISNYLTDPDTVNGDAETFVSGFAGLKTYVQIPTLTNLQNVGINKAELIFTVEGTPDTTFSAPPALLLVKTDSTLKNKFAAVSYASEIYYSIVDQGTTGFDYGGKLDTIVNRFGQTVYVYKYDLSLYFQDIILGREENNGMMLICYAGNRLPNGVRLCGSDFPDTTKRPYLSITYTLVNP